MDQSEIKAICDQRMVRWQIRLLQEHATPILMVGIGHDHKSGQVVLCTTEDLEDDKVLIFLEETLNLMKRQLR